MQKWFILPNLDLFNTQLFPVCRREDPKSLFGELPAFLNLKKRACHSIVGWPPFLRASSQGHFIPRITHLVCIGNSGNWNRISPPLGMDLESDWGWIRVGKGMDLESGWICSNDSRFCCSSCFQFERIGIPCVHIYAVVKEIDPSWEGFLLHHHVAVWWWSVFVCHGFGDEETEGNRNRRSCHRISKEGHCYSPFHWCKGIFIPRT